MKHNRLFGCLLAIAMLMVASVSAMAQEYVLKTVSFLKPGEKGVLAVSLVNPNPVKSFQGKIFLPEGLTFVETETPNKFQISKTERTGKYSLALQKGNDNNRVAAFLGFTMSDTFVAAGQGDILTFEVNVAKDFKATSELQIKESQISMGGGNIVKPEQVVTGKVANAADQMFASTNEVKVAVGTPSKVTISCDFQKEFLKFFAATIVLPEGLSLVKDSELADPDRCPNHTAAIVNNLLTLTYTDIFGNLLFTKKDGAVASFDVVADDKFVDGSEIILKNINAVAKVDGANTAFYAEDLHIKVTKDGTATGINGIESDFAAKADGIYTVSGLKVNKLVKGINIVVKDGKATKVVKK